MNDEQKEIGEKIISLLKSKKDNIISKNELIDLNQDWPYVKSIIESLKELNLIIYYGNKLKLTTFGHNFSSFNELEIKEVERNQRAEIELEKLKIDLALNKWLLKTKWIPLVVSILSLIFTIIIYLKSNNLTTEQNQRIENLELKLEEHDTNP